MSKNPNVEKAAQVLDENGFCGEDEAAEALDAAGLLVTPLHRRALEACKAYHKYHECSVPLSGPPTLVFSVGREAIALEKPKAEEEPEPVIERIKRMWRSVRERNKIPGPLTDALDELIKQPGCAEKPKERWVATSDASGCYVHDTVNRLKFMNGFVSSTQARAVAKALNEVSE